MKKLKLIIMMLIVTLCIAVPNINITEIHAIVYGLIIYNSFISWARIMLLICVELTKNWSCLSFINFRTRVMTIGAVKYRRIFSRMTTWRERKKKRNIYSSMLLSMRRQNANACCFQTRRMFRFDASVVSGSKVQ